MAMKVTKLVRTFLWFLVSLAALTAFTVLDWYPAVKELGHLRREHNDLALKTKNHIAMASRFAFPDEEEKSLFAQSHVRLSQSLINMADDAAWLELTSSWLRRQAEADKISAALLLFSSAPDGKVEPGIRLTGQWSSGSLPAGRLQEIQEGFRGAAPAHFPWKGLFFDPSAPMSEPLAARPLALILEAPLSAILNFINHCSRSDARLEIVRLHLEPGAPLSRAWLVCRGSYLVRAPSPWGVKMKPGDGDDGLLIDSDSPLLWQKVDTGAARPVKKNELPPVGSPW
jgi:hypothetical protein